MGQPLSRQRPHDSGDPSSATSRSEECVRALAKRYGISPTTVQKWRKRETTADQPMGPKEPHSTTLSLEQEAMIVAFRRDTLLPLDDCLYALQPSIAGLTRSSLHRCLTARHFAAPRLGGRQVGPEEVQDRPNGLLPHGYCRGAHG